MFESGHFQISTEIVAAIRYAMRQVDVFFIADTGLAINGLEHPSSQLSHSPEKVIHLLQEAKIIGKKWAFLIEAVQHYLIESDDAPEITKADYS